MRLGDQHLSREEAVGLSDEYRRASDEWLGRYATTVLAGNGAGLVALAAYLASRTVEMPAYILLCLAGVSFLAGVTLAALALSAFQRAAEVQGLAYQAIVDQKNFEQHFIAAMSKDGAQEDVAKFRQHMSANTGKTFEFADTAHAQKRRLLGLAVISLIAGISLTIAAVAIGSFPKAALAPEAEKAPRLLAAAQPKSLSPLCTAKGAAQRANYPAS